MTESTLLIILGFVLSTILGGIWGYLLKRRSWQHETRHSLVQARFDEGSRFLDELSVQIGSRFFGLQRLLWAIQDSDTAYCHEREKEYYSTVMEWNSTYWRNRNKIRLFVGEAFGDGFLDYNDYGRAEPASVHYMFVAAHRAVMKAVKDPSAMPQAKQRVDKLNWRCSVYLEKLTSEFLTKAAALQLFDIPASPGGAEQAAAERHPLATLTKATLR